jgi:hypothetical protein
VFYCKLNYHFFQKTLHKNKKETLGGVYAYRTHLAQLSKSSLCFTYLVDRSSLWGTTRRDALRALPEVRFVASI